ncbi:MAG TPA: hypothetical protein PLY96_10730 [Chromatiaceae bacterium]|nr:hypothetical protein [Chromatiaceae bacterium]
MSNPNTSHNTTSDLRAFQTLQGTPLPPDIAADHPSATAGPASLATATPLASAVGALDLSSLRLGQDFGVSIGVKKVITTIPVGKPNPRSFYRVHPDEDYGLTTNLLELGRQQESYLVAPPLWGELASELRPVRLLTAITRNGDLFLWPLKLPGPDGRSNSWNESAMAAAKQAETAWCRMQANMELGAYNLTVAPPNSPLPEPAWPDLSFQEIMDIAFRGRYITSLDHPVVLQLRGLA